MQSQSPLFAGKVVIVTGAGGGIGRAHAHAFAKEGAMVVVNDVGGNREGVGTGQAMADIVVDEIKALGGQAAAHYESIASLDGAQSLMETALKAFGRIDILVNNAGILRDKTLLKMEESMWDSVIAVHLKGTFACSQAFARHVAESGHGGRIINTTSYAGLIGNFGQANYSAAKAGIYGLTVTAALELRGKGITVNAVAPMAKTRMTTEISMIPDDMLAEQISPMVLYLASDEADEITGKIFGIHGQQIFPYVMKMFDGVTKSGKEFWTPREIGSRIQDIIREGLPPVSAAAAAPTPAPAAPKDPVEEAFSMIPLGFVPEKATGKKFNIFFDLKNGPAHSILLQDGALSVAKGQSGTPTCTVKTDADTIIGMFSGKIKPESAFMQGKISATNIQDMMTMGQVLSFKKAQEVLATRPAAATAAPAAQAAPTDPIGHAFSMVPLGFVPEKATGKKFNIYFDLKDGAGHSIILADGSLKVEKGSVGTPTCTVKTDSETVIGMFGGKIKPESAFMQGKISATNIQDMMTMGQVLSFKKAQEAMASRPPLAPAAVSTAPGTPTDPVTQAFSMVPMAFVQEKATGKKFNIYFELKDGPGHSIILADGALKVEKGSVGTPSCTVKTDAETIVGMFGGKIKPESAFMQGKISATNIQDMMTMGQVLSFKKAQEAMAAKAAQASAAPAAAPAGDPIQSAFANMPNAFLKEKAGSWKATLHFEIKGSTNRSVAIADGQVTVSEGLNGTADCVIKTDADTISGLLTGSVDGQKAFMQGKISASNMGVLMKFSQFFKFQPAPAAPASAAPATSAAAAPVEVDRRSIIGRRYDGGLGFAREEHMVAYAKAVNDNNPAFVDTTRADGIVAHPIFPVRLFNDGLYKVAMDSDLALDLSRLVHGEQDIYFLAPIRPFDLLNVRAALHDVQEKEAGTTVTARIYAYRDGEKVVEALSTLFIRARGKKKEGEAKTSEAKPSEAKPVEEAPARREILVSESFMVDKDQAIRYADASLDRNPIHLDEGAARAAGLPGCILHGLCTMAMSTRPIVTNLAGGDPTRLKRFSVRFSRPVFPGDRLRVDAWKDCEKDGRIVYGFEVTNDSGVKVISNGIAEVV